jgi:RNA polymerase sporulation-specific sigma factor
MKKITEKEWRTVVKNFGLLYKMLKKFNCNNEIEDEIIYDYGLPALMRASQNFDEELGHKFSTFACVAIYRSYLNYFSKIKKRRKELFCELNLDNDDSHPVAEVDNSVDIKDFIDNKMSILSKDQRKDIHMKFFEDLSYKEMSEKLSISTQACHQRIQKAIQMIGDSCTEDEIEIMY